MAAGYDETGVYFQLGTTGASFGWNWDSYGVNLQVYQQISAGVSATTGYSGQLSFRDGRTHSPVVGAGVAPPSFVPTPFLVTGSFSYNFIDGSKQTAVGWGLTDGAEVGIYHTHLGDDPMPSRNEFINVRINPRQQGYTQEQNPNFDKTDSNKYNGPQIGGTSPSDIATKIQTLKQPGGQSFLASGRDQKDNPYNPSSGAPQVGGTDRGEVAKTVLTKVINAPDYKPVTGQNPFQDRGGPTGLNSQPASNGYDGPGSAGKVPSHLTGTKASTGGNSHDTPSYSGSGSNGGREGGSYTPKATPSTTKAPANTYNSDSYNHSTYKPEKTAPTKTTSSGGGSNTWGSSGGTQPRDSSGNSTYKNEAGKSISKTNTKSGPKPIVLDLDNDGIEITELSRSTTFIDAKGDGLLHRTAWAGAGDGVLFYDAGNDSLITEKREYVFTEWDPTATSDLKALKAAFDSNGDGKLTAADADFSKFKVMVTNADGRQTAKTLAELGITEINLNAEVALVTLPDGSQISGANDNRRDFAAAA
jgi:hypothetical protein